MYRCLGWVLLMENNQDKSGVVTFIDILGWKGIYNRKSNALQTLRGLIQDLRKKAEQFRGFIKSDICVTSISDTIIISSYCANEESSKAIQIHGKLCEWLIWNSLFRGLPVRGAISYGEYEHEENIFIGKAIDEAASWYEQAEWIGAHLTPSAEYVFNPADNHGLWLAYNPPFKNRMDWNPHCIDWIGQLKGNEIVIRKSIEMRFLEMRPISIDFAPKLTNTMNYVNKRFQALRKSKAVE